MPSLPSMFSDLKYRLRAIFRRERMEHELAAELQFHCERMAAKLVAAGVPRDEALRRARLRSAASSRSRKSAARRVASPPSSRRSRTFSYGLRQLRRRPGFARWLSSRWRSASAPTPRSSASSTRSCSACCRSTIRPGCSCSFPARRTATLAASSTRSSVASAPRTRRSRTWPPTAPPDSTSASMAAASSPLPKDSWSRAATSGSSAFTAIAGRTIEPADDVNPNGHPVAVISHGYWQRRFGLEPSAVGRTIHLSGTPFTIIGVAPREFFGLEVGRAPDIWVPIMMQPTVMPAAENWLGEHISRTFWLTLVGSGEA